MLYEKSCYIKDYMIHINKIKFLWFSLRTRVGNTAMAEEAKLLQRRIVSNL